ncbi:hypothetical protein J2W83_001064 [Pseudomonas hunanensis]|uniref:Uncharacterized protein n=1 Tax=Pseudomonas hunanensis TaxID=1247546 RepID=A0ACC6JZ67_9PSED|nr:hypothetical protein [Pseudomonas hunanensis]
MNWLISTTWAVGITWSQKRVNAFGRLVGKSASTGTSLPESATSY